MSAVEFDGKVTLWTGEGRLNVGFKSPDLPPSVRLSTKLESHVGKALAAEMTRIELTKVVEQLHDPISCRATVLGGMLHLDMAHNTQARISVLDDLLDIRVYRHSPHAPFTSQMLSLVRKVLKVKDSVSAWRDADEMYCTEAVVMDLLKASKVATLGHSFLQIGQAKIYLGGPDEPLVHLEATQASNQDVLEAVYLLASMSSQQEPGLALLVSADRPVDVSDQNLPVYWIHRTEEGVVMVANDYTFAASVDKVVNPETFASTLVLSDFAKFDTSGPIEVTEEDRKLLASALRRSTGLFTRIDEISQSKYAQKVAQLKDDLDLDIDDAELLKALQRSGLLPD